MQGPKKIIFLFFSLLICFSCTRTEIKPDEPVREYKPLETPAKKEKPKPKLKSIVSGFSALRTPKLVLAGNDVYLLWSDDKSGNAEIYIGKYNGDEIVAQKQLTNSQTNSLDPAGVYVEANQSLFIAWMEKKSTEGGTIYYSLTPIAEIFSESFHSVNAQALVGCGNLADYPLAIRIQRLKSCEKIDLAVYVNNGQSYAIIDTSEFTYFLRVADDGYVKLLQDVISKCEIAPGGANCVYAKKVDGYLVIKNLSLALSPSGLLALGLTKVQGDWVATEYRYFAHVFSLEADNDIKRGRGYIVGKECIDNPKASLVYEPQNNVFGFFRLINERMDDSALLFQRLSANGEPSGEKVRLQEFSGNRSNVDYAAAAGDGKFGIAYKKEISGDNYFIKFMIISAAGEKIGDELVGMAKDYSHVSIVYKNGGWRIVWDSSNKSGSHIFSWTSDNFDSKQEIIALQAAPAPAVKKDTVVKDPALVVAGNDTYLLWSGNRTGNSEIYLGQYNDGQVTKEWQVTNDLADSVLPSAVYVESKQSLLVTWLDSRCGKLADYYVVVPIAALTEETRTSLIDFPQKLVDDCEDNHVKFLFIKPQQRQYDGYVQSALKANARILAVLIGDRLYSAELNDNGVLLMPIQNDRSVKVRDFVFSSNGALAISDQGVGRVNFSALSFIGDMADIKDVRGDLYSLVYEPTNSLFGLFWTGGYPRQISRFVFRRLSASGQTIGDNILLYGEEDCGYNCSVVMKYKVAAGNGGFGVVFFAKAVTEDNVRGTMYNYNLIFIEVSAVGTITKRKILYSTPLESLTEFMDRKPEVSFSLLNNNGKWQAVWAAFSDGEIHNWRE